MPTNIQNFEFSPPAFIELEDDQGFIELENGSGNIAQEISNSVISNNILKALLWRFNNALVLQSLITQKSEWYGEFYDQFWSSWYSDVFNLPTANAFGCAVWAIILNLPIQINNNPDPPDKPIFGFGPDVGSWEEGYGQNFYNANFSFGGTILDLTVAQRRFILQLRYFQLQSDCATPSINAFLPLIVNGVNEGSGTIYCVDNLDMTVTYVFTFTPDEQLIPALLIYDVLPRPAGVALNIVTP